MNGHLSEELAQNHFNLLEKLEGVLFLAVSQIERVASSVDPGAKGISRITGRWKYALVKKSLDTLINELEEWQARFDPSWYLIQLISSERLNLALDQTRGNRLATMVHSRQDQSSPRSPLDNMVALRQAITDEHSSRSIQPQNSMAFDDTKLDLSTKATIPYSTATTILQKAPNKRLLIMEPIDLAAGPIPQTLHDAEYLARKLQHIDPDTFGLLRCSGLIKTTTAESDILTNLAIIFQSPLPQGPPPTTLRHLLLNQSQLPPVSLSTIVSLAKSLVRSLSFIHACDLVHKNIRPENILVSALSSPPLAPSSSSSSSSSSQPHDKQLLLLSPPYLIGFSSLRAASPSHIMTNLVGSSSLAHNLYRHPERQGLCILQKYVMQHDIYSVGVCLLEIGLWRSFIRFGRDGTGTPKVGYALDPALRKDLTEKDFENAHIPGTTSWIKQDLVEFAKRELPQQMGDLYTDVVVECLTCLDEGNKEWETKRKEENDGGVGVGVRFVERILGRVEEISV